MVEQAALEQRGPHGALRPVAAEVGGPVHLHSHPQRGQCNVNCRAGDRAPRKHN